MIREMYQCYIEQCDEDKSKLQQLYPQALNPFWDPPSDVLLGRARIQLEALAYCMDITDDWTPLVDYKGKQEGEIMVNFIPSSPQVDLDELDELSELKDSML